MMLTQDAMAGKRALVTGASQGIGKACALALAQAGAQVTLLARNPSGLEQALSELQRISPGHRAFPCDLAAIERLPEVLKQIGPEIDIYIGNSGGPKPGPIAEAQPEDFLQAFSQHFLAQQLCVQHVLPSMKQKKFGRIITILSTSVKIPLPGLGVSNSIRGAVASWSKTLASELAAFGITVNNILPGYTETQRLQEILRNTAARTGKTEEEVRQGFLKEVPAARFASPEETAAACLFLASPFASYINGINLPVDGGRTGCL